MDFKNTRDVQGKNVVSKKSRIFRIKTGLKKLEFNKNSKISGQKRGLKKLGFLRVLKCGFKKIWNVRIEDV